MAGDTLSTMSPDKIPFEFVLDCLFAIEVRIRPMFGMYAIYEGERVLLMMRNQEHNPELNGIWVATDADHIYHLKNEIPLLHSISSLTNDRIKSEWLLLSNQENDFEITARKLCEYIVKGDPRIGRTSFNQ